MTVDFEPQHASAVAQGDALTASKIRWRARRAAARLRVAVPDWAAVRQGEPTAPCPPKPALTEPAPIAVSPALSAWRAGRGDRVVNIRRDGSVRLVVLGVAGAHQEAAFTDARTAERALLLGITWRSVGPAPDTRPRTSGGRVATR